MNNFNKILNLVKKTGDKIIIMKEDGTNFVLMHFNDYEKIVAGKYDVKDLSEQELWDKVDRDISLWRERHEDYYGDDELPMSFDRAQDYQPEPWEMEKESWEREDFEDSEDPFEFDEEEMSAITENTEEALKTQKRFQSPLWDSEMASETLDGDRDEEKEPLKYEDIPPPPSLNISDVMDEDDDKKEEIIDMSFEDEEDLSDDSEEPSEFMEEPVF